MNESRPEGVTASLSALVGAQKPTHASPGKNNHHNKQTTQRGQALAKELGKRECPQRRLNAAAAAWTGLGAPTRFPLESCHEYLGTLGLGDKDQKPNRWEPALGFRVPPTSVPLPVQLSRPLSFYSGHLLLSVTTSIFSAITFLVSLFLCDISA